MTEGDDTKAQAVETEGMTIPLKGIRGAVARNMTQGWQSPQVCIAIEVNMSAVYQAQKDTQAALKMEKRISITAFILYALAKTLKAHPNMNAQLLEKEIKLKPEINIALAVNLDDGLATPVIRNADTLTLKEVSDSSKVLAQAARDGKLAPKAYQGGTFTISNLGMTGIDWFSPIINPPQVGILGIGTVLDKVVVVKGEVVIAPIMNLSLVFDHRAIDGYPAAIFLNDLKETLETEHGFGL